MKTRPGSRMLFLLFVALPALIPGLTHSEGPVAAPGDALQGTWRLVSSEITPAGGAPVGATDRDWPHGAFKIFSGTHFAFGHQSPDGTVVAGGGRYTFDGEILTEVADYHSDPGLVGQPQTFEIKIVGDKLTQEGENNGVKVEEKYERVE